MRVCELVINLNPVYICILIAMAAAVCVNVNFSAYSCGVLVYIVAIVLVSWNLNLKVLRNRKHRKDFCSWYRAVYRNGYQNCCDGQVINRVLPRVLAVVGYTSCFRFLTGSKGDVFSSSPLAVKF